MPCLPSGHKVLARVASLHWQCCGLNTESYLELTRVLLCQTDKSYWLQGKNFINIGHRKLNIFPSSPSLASKHSAAQILYSTMETPSSMRMQQKRTCHLCSGHDHSSKNYILKCCTCQRNFHHRKYFEEVHHIQSQSGFTLE